MRLALSVNTALKSNAPVGLLPADFRNNSPYKNRSDAYP